MKYQVLKRFIDGPRFGLKNSEMREAGDIVEASGMRLMKLSAYGIVRTYNPIETSVSEPAEKRGRGRPRKI